MDHPAFSPPYITARAEGHAAAVINAIHSHMEGEQPRAIFLHYRGVGPTRELGKGIRAALDAQKTATRQ